MRVVCLGELEGSSSNKLDVDDEMGELKLGLADHMPELHVSESRRRCCMTVHVVKDVGKHYK